MSEGKGKRAVVLVHGAWHGAWCWEPVVPYLYSQGIVVAARDLPGHGMNARLPESFRRRPLDPNAFASEPSSNAGISLDDYAESILDTIDRLLGAGFGPVTLVGHSMGGVAITAVGERAPDKLARLVYLTAFMPASGVVPASYIGSVENEGEKVGGLLMADPARTGAMRIDPRSADETYRRMLRDAFFNDAADELWDVAAHLMTPDVSAAAFSTPIATTPERWGRVPRSYIRCSKDNAIRPGLQDRFIRDADKAAPANPTDVRTLESGHSPFLSMPEKLGQLLAEL